MRQRSAMLAKPAPGPDEELSEDWRSGGWPYKI